MEYLGHILKNRLRDEIERQGIYFRDDDDCWLVDGHLYPDEMVKALIDGIAPKVSIVPCPHADIYDRSECCGLCISDYQRVIIAVREILTDWNFGATPDRDALVRIHAFVGDLIQNAPGKP